MDRAGAHVLSCLTLAFRLTSGPAREFPALPDAGSLGPRSAGRASAQARLHYPGGRRSPGRLRPAALPRSPQLSPARPPLRRSRRDSASGSSPYDWSHLRPRNRRLASRMQFPSPWQCRWCLPGEGTIQSGEQARALKPIRAEPGGPELGTQDAAIGPRSLTTMSVQRFAFPLPTDVHVVYRATRPMSS